MSRIDILTALLLLLGTPSGPTGSTAILERPAESDDPRPASSFGAELLRATSGFDALFPGWSGTVDPGAPLLEGPPATLLARLPAAGDDASGRAAAIALRVASSFRGWSDRHLPPPPRFVDGEIPAPAAWVERLMPQAIAREAALLEEALQEPDIERTRELARDLARLRFRRIAMLHDEQVASLRQGELRDGLAAYAAYRALESLDESPAQRGAARPAGARSRLARLEAILFDALGSAASREPSSLTPEVSGLAIGLLLDRVRPGWTLLLAERNTSLDVLLAGPPKSFGNRPPASP